MSLLYREKKPQNPNADKYVRIIEKYDKTELTDEFFRRKRRRY